MGDGDDGTSGLAIPARSDARIGCSDFRPLVESALPFERFREPTTLARFFQSQRDEPNRAPGLAVQGSDQEEATNDADSVVFVPQTTDPTVAALLRAHGVSLESCTETRALDVIGSRPPHPACVVLDRPMPGGFLDHGLEQAEPRVPVVVADTKGSLPSGLSSRTAVTFVAGTPLEQTLLPAVQAALDADRRWLAMCNRAKRIDSVLRRLTKQQRETLEAILRWEPNKQIAARFGITERAVELRRASICKRFEVASTTALVEAVVTHRVLAEVDAIRSHPGFASRGIPVGDGD